MIAIGNAVNKFYLDQDMQDTDNIEFICWTEKEIEKVQKEHKLKKSIICHSNTVTRVYKKHNRFISIHDATATPVFNLFKKHYPAIEFSNDIAPPTFTYAWAISHLDFIHNNIEDWVMHAKVANELYIKYYKEANPTFLMAARTLASHLTRFGALGYSSTFTPHKYKDYTDFSEESLFDLFKYNNQPSLFQKCSLETHTGKTVLSNAIFKRLPYKEQIGCVLERLYVDYANEFLINDYLYQEPDEMDILKLFNKCIMYNSTRKLTTWFQEFIIHNYNEIINAFDFNFIDELEDAIMYNMLDRSLPNLRIIK
jgi:hypothetical protein